MRRGAVGPVEQAMLAGIGDGPRKRELGQWDTPPALARALVRWAEVGPGDLVVDASCGIGNVLDAARGEGADALGVELDAERAELARARGFGVVTGDALADADLVSSSVERYARELRAPLAPFAPNVVAVGNPPYERGGALAHPASWLGWAERAVWIAPLVTLASASRLPVWDSIALRHVGVLVPRPKFGAQGGSQEIAFFWASRRYSKHDPAEPPTLGWIEWEAFGAPEAAE